MKSAQRSIDELRLKCWSQPQNGWSIGFMLWGCRMDMDERKKYSAIVTFVEDKKGDFVHRDPSFSLTRERAQQLMDDLWTCGLRPSEGTGSAGALAAVERHLADMQRLVFERPSPLKPIVPPI
jgi:hypothetical protein